LVDLTKATTVLMTNTADTTAEAGLLLVKTLTIAVLKIVINDSNVQVGLHLIRLLFGGASGSLPPSMIMDIAETLFEIIHAPNINSNVLREWLMVSCDDPKKRLKYIDPLIAAPDKGACKRILKEMAGGKKKGDTR
jgi:hypothetical protein